MHSQHSPRAEQIIMHSSNADAAQVVIVGAGPSGCKPPDSSIASLDKFLRRSSNGNPLNTVDDVREMCAGMQAHLRKGPEQTEARVLAKYKEQVGQVQRWWQVHAPGEPLGGADYVAHEWQRGINKDLSTAKCERAFKIVRGLFDGEERNAAWLVEAEFAGSFNEEIIRVNMRASHTGDSTSIRTSMEPSTRPKLVLECAQTNINGTAVLFYNTSEGRAQRAVNAGGLAKTLARFSIDATGRTCSVVYVLAGCNADTLILQSFYGLRM
jgi:hypothetical protein